MHTKGLTRRELKLRVLFNDLERLPVELRGEITHYIGPKNYWQWQLLLHHLENLPIDQKRLDIGDKEVDCLIASDNNLVFGSNDYYIGCFDSPMKSITLKDERYQANVITLLADKRLAIGHSRITILQPNLDAVEPSIEGHPATFITSLIQMRDGNLISGDKDGKIKVWDLHNFNCIKKLELHTGQIECLLELSDGSLACCSEDKMVTILGSNYELKVGRSFLASVSSIVQLQDKKLAIGLINSSLELWDIDNDTTLILGNSNDIESDHQLLMYDNLLFTITEYKENDITSFVRGPYEITLKIWDTDVYTLIRESKFRAHESFKLACLLKNKKLVLGHEEGVLTVWNMESIINGCTVAKQLMKHASIFEIIYLKMLQDSKQKNMAIDEAKSALGSNSLLVELLQKLKEPAQEVLSCIVQ